MMNAKMIQCVWQYLLSHLTDLIEYAKINLEINMYVSEGVKKKNKNEEL